MVAMKRCIIALALACVGMAGAAVTATIELNGTMMSPPTGVTITMTGPKDQWFAIAFGGTAMKMAGSYAIIAKESTTGVGPGTVMEYKMVGTGNPGSELTASKITVMSNVVSGTDRTITMTRVLAGANSDYFTFADTPQAIPALWAMGQVGVAWGAGAHATDGRGESWSITSTNAVSNGNAVAGSIRAAFSGMGVLMAVVALLSTLGVMPSMA